ncbi:hypothetical protein [Bacillus thuringiensis]|uniref:hypothetical protein n=3 Tax=Bacillus thuringiensis TaxID=1428 RepID=UPI002DBFE4CA|nr:hypothetical protein [Bacillus thuringiensis]MEC3463089.1 hypothetical protein [Bacillus thuringiensis]MEC3553991.1 hypothetical protein [Bacillus thuringiensis]
MQVYLDRLMIKYKDVTEKQFSDVLSKISSRQIFLPNTPINPIHGTSIRDYHRVIHIGHGEGAIFIGWKHNSANEKDSYDMKVEFNPSKFENNELQKDGYEKVFEIVFGTLNTVLKSNKRVVNGMDIAFDMERSMSDIVSYSKTGRQQDRHKGTIYYGNRNKNGYLKIYDKKKELLAKFGRLVESEFLTRIEYSWRDSDGVVIDEIRKSPPFSIDESYVFSILDLKDVRGALKACLICYSNGTMDMKEFPRRTKESIKKALEEMDHLAVDTILQDCWLSILENIKNYTRL